MGEKPRKQSLRNAPLLLGAVALTVLLSLILHRYDNKYASAVGGAAVQAALEQSPVVYLTEGWEIESEGRFAPADLAEARVPDDMNVADRGEEWYGVQGSGPVTYRLVLRLPDQPRGYALELPANTPVSQVCIDGALAADHVDDTPKAPSRPGERIIPFWAGGETEILITAPEDRMEPLGLGRWEAVAALYAGRRALRLLLCLTALSLGLLFLTVGVGGRSRPLIGCGLACVLFACWVAAFAPDFAALLDRPESLQNGLMLLNCGAVLFLQYSMCGFTGPLYRTATVCAAGICIVAVLAPWMAVRRFFQLATAAYLLTMSVLAVAGRKHMAAIPLTGAACFGTALLADLCLPGHEPIWSVTLPQLGGALLTGCLGLWAWARTVQLYRENQNLRTSIALFKQRESHAAGQLALQARRFGALEADIAATRRARHDLRHHHTMLASLLQTDPRAALDYLQKLTAALPTPAQTYCQNIAVDCMLRPYVAKARETGISTEVAVEIPRDLGISDLDLCVALGNLLENALVALRKMKTEENPMLRITAGTTGKVLAVNIDNTLHKQTIRDGPAAWSSNTGLGLSSVRAVAEKYEGKLWCRAENGMFRASIVLRTENR